MVLFLLIQVGVTEQMYVGHAHSRPWLLHSFKVVRANEELGSLKESGKLYQGHGPLTAPDEEGPLPAQDEQGGGGENQDDVEKIKTNEDATSSKGEQSKAGEEELGRGKRKVIKSRRISDDAETQGENIRHPKSRRGSLDDNRGGEDILINPRRKNPQVAAF